jgi:predicted sulfurtransferase
MTSFINPSTSIIPTPDDCVFLLYYQYCIINDPVLMNQNQTKLCSDLGIKGRIRVSGEGLNGTVNGTKSSIDEYIRVMIEDKDYIEINGGSIHWKKSTLVHRYSFEDQIFTDLSCKVTKEVVSLDLSMNETISYMNNSTPGIHLTPKEFHNKLEQNNNIDIKGNTNESKGLVLIDCRNVYESRIGRFEYKQDDEVIAAIDPNTRKFSEFCDFIDDNVNDFKDKEILMYCTGGVRCERASTYMKGKGLADVYQLSGGIHGYMDEFPDGGFFKGKNFVYDKRIAIPYSNCKEEIIGKCQVCLNLFDDYEKKIRCSNCRMLLLICNDCTNNENVVIDSLKCELCLDKNL